MTFRTLPVIATAVLFAVAITACAPAQSSPPEDVIDSEKYVELYKETVASFPEPLPAGIKLPDEPPPMSGDIGRGNAAAMAYSFWGCAWEDVYLNSTDETQRAEAMTQLREFPNTVWAIKYYEDPDGVWPATLDAAELGDLTVLREFYETDCEFYRMETV